jgi:DNA polymerase-3 subunit delta
VKDYETAAAKYSIKKTVEVVGLLRTYDMKSKGFGDLSSTPGDLLKELLYKILHN